MPLTLPRRLPNRTILRVMHALVSPGASEADKFRGWARLIYWYTLRTGAGRRHVIRQLLNLPLRAARKAHGGVSEFGDEVEQLAGVPRWRQRSQLWWLQVRHGIHKNSYLDCQLYQPDRTSRANRYIQEWEAVIVHRFINQTNNAGSDVGTLESKRRFMAWCREHDLPTTETLMEFKNGEVIESKLPAGVLPPCDLFTKPTNSTGGHGTARWVYDGQGSYLGADGRKRTPAELLEEIAVISRTLPQKHRKVTRRLMVQRALINHAALLPIAPGALSTVRLLTYRWPNEKPKLLYGAYKIPRGQTAADNFLLGGVLVTVDSTTGTLGHAVYRRGRFMVTTDRHPDTGAVIAGRQLPIFHEAVAVVLRAHETLRRVPAVGWDVGLTTDGPRLLEGNSSPHPGLGQFASGVPLGETPYVACMNAYTRECFGL
jgi:hypothetical protein